jgi:hypothetical protein
VRQHDVHTEARHQRDDRLRHGERLSIRRRIRPAHRDLLAAQRFERTERAHQVHQIRHRLRRMVLIALQVDNRRPLRQHARAEALLNRRGDLRHVLVSLAQEDVVADADHFGHE